MWLTRMVDGWDEAAAAADDANKPAVPYEVGASLAFPELPPDTGLASLAAAVQERVRHPNGYYDPAAPDARLTEARYENGWLSFTSAIRTELLNNDTVHARIFESRKRRDAIILVPYWNSPANAMISLAQVLNRLGFSVAVLILPYHHQRGRPGSIVADYFVSANLGRTIRAVRQAVFDVYGIVDWLQSRGHSRFSIVGASLGSCVAGLAGAFDARLRSTLLLLTAGSFADVVWTGRATRHIGSALKNHVTLEELRTIWSIISLDTFCAQFRQNDERLLIVSATRDKVVLPVHTHAFLRQLRDAGAAVSHTALPCGHYTLGMAPFSVLAGLRALVFLRAPAY